MSREKLNVLLNEKLVGYLDQSEHGEMLFQYAVPWLEEDGAIPISRSLPLRRDVFNQKECRGFFAGLLPGENKREVLAGILGISAKDDFRMLEKLGGECAGSITFRSPELPVQEDLKQDRVLNDQELAMILRALPRNPLMAGEEGVRISLAGGQDKIAVRVCEEVLSIPLWGSPSTHILKPGIGEFEGIVFNEAVCLTLGAQVGLQVSQMEIGQVEGIDYLLVERYDRIPVQGGKPQRMHQEDFCQALGGVPERKYQSDGGPTLKQCFNLLRTVSSAPVIDLQQFLNAIIFHALIGNHDAHAKNFALRYGSDKTLRLAPLYDVVNTAYYPELSQQLAMEIGGEYRSDHLLPSHFEKLAEEAGLAKPLVVKRVPELANRVLTHLQDIRIRHNVACLVLAQIKKRCEAFLRRFKK